MSTPIPIPARVPRLVPLLGSPVDGEALGACRAIGRTLGGAGLDFNDLAAAIRPEPGPGAPAAAPPGRAAPKSYGDWREAWAWRHRERRFTPRQEAEQRAQARYCRENLYRLRPREQEFVRTLNTYARSLSYAQAAWLADLADRLDHDLHAHEAAV